MSEIIHPGAGVLFMKVGTHAQESLADIIARKTREIEATGIGMWGYGGNTCHPSSMVQPFAEDFARRNEPIHLVMEEMDSKHFAEPLCAAEYSVDGREWKEIPKEIEVRGSRFALVIRKLRQAQFELPLARTRVAVGNSKGRLGSRYIAGRVDKACLEVLEEPERSNEEQKVRPINLVADLEKPYAVFLRNYR
ncbi:hypothetical protein SAMN06297144_1195 [Sphingomonas guangdongensis]|uniref:Uncharacterized protein n=1 Tax=Sphingomonas guangdongensis TaxID=1141890 RepID=A0A285QFJ9_9SPHN|nr:hypothetical protein [Sphingomonas guangdongensis]SOB80700.1 hypothetical protein SAMN06297144_1195 [Sphingomonas guangdongensis]